MRGACSNLGSTITNVKKVAIKVDADAVLGQVDDEIIKGCISNSKYILNIHPHLLYHVPLLFHCRKKHLHRPDRQSCIVWANLADLYGLIPEGNREYGDVRMINGGM